MQKSLFVLATFALAACGGKAPAAKPTPAKASTTAKANTAALKTQKPASATKTSTPPKAIPAAKTAGKTSVKPPELKTSEELETWDFTDVDLDGDGAGESGVIAADDKNLVAWFTGAVDNEGTTLSYEGVVWVVPEGVGFLFDYGSAGALACAETASGTSGCVSCKGTECTEIGLEGPATK